MMKSSQEPSTRADVILATVVLGSLWGFSEVVLNAGVRATMLPLRAGLLTGVAMLLMGVALGMFRRLPMLPAMVIIAMACKQMVVPLLNASLLCKANSCLAMTLQTGALVALVGLLRQRIRGKTPGLAMMGAAAALSSAGAFWRIGMHLAPCAYLLSFSRPGGFVSFLATEGLTWAAVSAVSLPMGYRWGVRLARSIPALRAASPRIYYASSVGIAAACWIASGFAISAGL